MLSLSTIDIIAYGDPFYIYLVPLVRDVFICIYRRIPINAQALHSFRFPVIFINANNLYVDIHVKSEGLLRDANLLPWFQIQELFLRN
jgi:hypothetical protein